MFLKDVIIHIRIEEQNKTADKAERAKELFSKENMVKEKPKPKFNKPKRQNPRTKPMSSNKVQNLTFKKKGNCFVYGKPGYYRKKLEKVNLRENLTKAEVIAAVVSFEVSRVTNMKDWIVGSRATRHIYSNRSPFPFYTTMKEGEEQVFMGDSRSSPMIGKGKVLLKLTFRKVLALSDVLHVPDIHWILVSVSLLGKVGVRIMFDLDKIVLTNNDAFCWEGLL